MNPTNRTAKVAGRDLVLKRLFDAPRELVWRLCTEREHARHWWGPRDFTVPELELESRPGGRWRAVLRSPQGEEYPQYGVVREMIQPERLAFTLVWEENGPESEMLCRFRFLERGRQTEMSFRKGPFKSASSLDSEREGWNESFDRLERYLEKI